MHRRQYYNEVQLSVLCKQTCKKRAKNAKKSQKMLKIATQAQISFWTHHVSQPLPSKQKQKKLSVLCKLTFCKAANYVKKRQVSQATVVVLVKYCPKRDEAFFCPLNPWNIDQTIDHLSWVFVICDPKNTKPNYNWDYWKEKKDDIVFGEN